jgi:hypothetical protein
LAILLIYSLQLRALPVGTDDHRTRMGLLGFPFQHASAHRLHRFDRIHDQVPNNLLQLNLVAFQGQRRPDKPTKRTPERTLVTGGPALTPLQQATRTIPIVFMTVSEPVALGFVANLARPGGNIIGFTNIEPTFGPKWLELLKEMAPRVTRFAVMFNPDTSHNRCPDLPIGRNCRQLWMWPRCVPAQSLRAFISDYTLAAG